VKKTVEIEFFTKEVVGFEGFAVLFIYQIRFVIDFPVNGVHPLYYNVKIANILSQF
jgi:hypothetical protein